MTKVAVRDNQLVVPTCPDCMCRLEKIVDHRDGLRYRHFGENLYTGRDARGCKCRLIGYDYLISNSQAVPISTAQRARY